MDDAWGRSISLTRAAASDTWESAKHSSSQLRCECLNMYDLCVQKLVAAASSSRMSAA